MFKKGIKKKIPASAPLSRSAPEFNGFFPEP